LVDGGEMMTAVVGGKPAQLVGRLPHTKGFGAPLWTADGRFLILGGRQGLTWLPADGSRPPQTLIHSDNPQVPWSFAPGGILAYHEMRPGTGFDLWTAVVRSSPSGLSADPPRP